MKAEWSKRFELDGRNLTQIGGAIVVGIISVYAANTDAYNAIIANHVSPEAFVVISGVLAYAMKKVLTDYSSK